MLEKIFCDLSLRKKKKKVPYNKACVRTGELRPLFSQIVAGVSSLTSSRALKMQFCHINGPKTIRDDSFQKTPQLHMLMTSINHFHY